MSNWANGKRVWSWITKQEVTAQPSLMQPRQGSSNRANLPNQDGLARELKLLGGDFLQVCRLPGFLRAVTLTTRLCSLCWPEICGRTRRLQPDRSFCSFTLKSGDVIIRRLLSDSSEQESGTYT